jgi:hypothetical protein
MKFLSHITFLIAAIMIPVGLVMIHPGLGVIWIGGIFLLLTAVIINNKE